MLVSFLVAVALTAAAAIGLGVTRPRPPSPSQPPSQPPRGEISVAYPHVPLTLNPYTFEGETIATHDLLRPVLPTLLRIGPDLRYGPSLALRVPAGRDVGGTPFSVTYHLDPRAMWSDGRPVTADDVRFTWQAILDPRPGTTPVADRSAYRHVTDVVAVDPHTVRLVFDGFYVWWPDLFSAGDFVLPRHDLEGKDLGAELRDHIRVGAGPFTIESWTPGLEIVYAANPRWWGSGPRYRRVHVLFVPSTEMAIQLLGQGTVQALATTTEPNLTGRLREIPQVRISSRYGSAWWELLFQHERPAMRNLPFRQAVATALDRRGMAEAFAREDGRALESLAPGWAPGPSKAFESVDLDRPRSQSLLAGLGSRPGPLALAGPSNSDLAELLQRAVQAGLQQVGVTAEIGDPDEDVLYGRWLQQGRFDLAVVERRGSPMGALAEEYRSTLHPPTGLNYSRLSSPAVDEALAAADSVKEVDAALADVVMRRLAAALPAVPLVEVKAFIAYRPGLGGVAASATIDGPFWNLPQWSPDS
ncbi:MAG TPA: ABC transporter substrate-binding protein [Actinomycetota bacterium]